MGFSASIFLIAPLAFWIVLYTLTCFLSFIQTIGRAKQIRITPRINSPKNPPSPLLLVDVLKLPFPASTVAVVCASAAVVTADYANPGTGVSSELS
jgi:hypothetical protein